MDSLLSFPVGLFHPLQHAGLSRRSPNGPSLGTRRHQFIESLDKIEKNGPAPIMQIIFIVVLGVIGFFVAILTLYVAGNWLLWRFRKPKSRSEESARRYRERLLNPRWNELELHFNQSIPARIKHLYAQTEIIGRRNIRVIDKNGATYDIAEFLPADIETLNGIWPDVKKSANFPLAIDAMGDCYCIPLTGDKSEQCPVMCYHHDGSDFESVSASLDSFWNGIERSVKS
jgi:hypothetical protein